MKRIVLLLALVILACGGGGAGSGGGVESQPTWVYAADLSDEFNGFTLDVAKWHNHNPTWPGRLPARFEPDQVEVYGGMLHLGAVHDPDLGGGYYIRSGYIKSKFELQYGRIEVRMRAIPRVDLASTAWLYGDEGTNWWTELGICELFTGKWPALLHFGSAEWEPERYATVFDRDVGCDLTQDFHLYVIEWTPTSICRFFDGDMTECIPNDHWFVPMTLNLDVEAPWDGEEGIDTAQLPQEMTVDYVRVWHYSEG